MDFYKSSIDGSLMMGKVTNADSFAGAPSQQGAPKINYFKTNNLGRVSEHFMNTLMNNHPL